MKKLVVKARRVPDKVRRLFRICGGAVVNFHNVGAPNVYTENLGVTMSAAAFEQRIAYLTDRFRVVPFSAFCQNKMDRTLAAVTFDDGYRCFLTEALPILEKYNCPAKMFLNADQVEGQLSWLNKLSAILAFSTPTQMKAFAARAVAQAKTAHPEQISFYRQNFEYPRTIEAVDETFGALDQTPPHGDLYLDAVDIKKLMNHPLVEWGSHTASHLPLEKLPLALQSEAILSGHHRLRPLLGKALTGFALPFGGAKLRTAPLAQIVAEIDDVFVTASGERIFKQKVDALPEIQRLRGDDDFARLKVQLK